MESCIECGSVDPERLLGSSPVPVVMSDGTMVWATSAGFTVARGGMFQRWADTSAKIVTMLGKIAAPDAETDTPGVRYGEIPNGATYEVRQQWVRRSGVSNEKAGTFTYHLVALPPTREEELESEILDLLPGPSSEAVTPDSEYGTYGDDPDVVWEALRPFLERAEDLPEIAYEDIEPGMVVERRTQYIKMKGEHPKFRGNGSASTYHLVSALSDPDAEKRMALQMLHPSQQGSVLLDALRADGWDLVKAGELS